MDELARKNIEFSLVTLSALREIVRKRPSAYTATARSKFNDIEAALSFTLSAAQTTPVSDTSDETGSDPVNHPSHYTSHPSGVEAITITRHCNFNVGNAIKYLWRHGLKDDRQAVQDLEKAVWYIQDEIKRLESLS